MPDPAVPYQVPFGGSSPRYPFQNRIGTSVSDHSLNLTQARAAKFLPRIKEDEVKQAPVVMYPGTIVGTLNEGHTNGALASYFGEKPNVLLPASAVGYKLVYTALDLNHSRYGSVYQIDTFNTLIAGAGTSTAATGTVLPLGVVQEPVFCEAWQLQRRNLRIQSKLNILSRGRQLRIPAITAEEKLIKPGDLVQVSDTAGNLDWIGAPAATYPGRWKAFDPTDTDCANIPFIVGRCVDKHRIATGTADTEMAADLSAGTTLTNVNTDQQYDTMGRVQTVPGLGLQGSGTQGVMAADTFARSDSNGDYWVLDIAIGVIGI